MNKPHFCPCPKGLADALGVGVGEYHLPKVGALYDTQEGFHAVLIQLFKDVIEQ